MMVVTSGVMWVWLLLFLQGLVTEIVALSGKFHFYLLGEYTHGLVV